MGTTKADLEVLRYAFGGHPYAVVRDQKVEPDIGRGPRGLWAEINTLVGAAKEFPGGTIYKRTATGWTLI